MKKTPNRRGYGAGVISKYFNGDNQKQTTIAASISVKDGPNIDDELDTDTKVAILKSLYPEKELEHDDLLEALIFAGGDIQKAEEAINSGSIMFRNKRAKKSASSGGASSTQASLSSYLPTNTSSTMSKFSIPKPIKGKPLLLYAPEHVSALTPCTLITNFFPPELAADLLKEMVEAAKMFPEKGSAATKFRMFGGAEVFSKHTSGFFVRGTRREDRQEAGQYGGKNANEWAEDSPRAAEDEIERDWRKGGGYLYNGIVAETGTVRGFTQTMEQATVMVEEKVNELIRNRWKRNLPDGAKSVPEGREKFESPLPWSTNAAFVNCYDGGGESVGWHADQLTYLGPMATIASVSLGVGREFGLKKEGEDEAGVIKIWLPHNSLLVMEAGTQERWKHCIYPSQAISRHPVSASKRINITFRCYRPSLAPRYTPKCRCPLPGVLRTVTDKSSENLGRYFWHCQGGYKGKGETGEGCGWFEWADLDEDGELKGWRERKKPSEAN